VLVVAVAIAGTALSLRIPPVRPAAPDRRVTVNPWSEIGSGLERLFADRVLWLTVVGLSYFWFLGSLLQAVMLLFGEQVMGLDERWVGVLLTFAAVGIAAGSMAAGRLSGDKVELGLAPSDRSAWASSRSCCRDRDTRSRLPRSTWPSSASSAACSPCR
jgi:hypothetical protein